jgi:hypothetical protein
MSAQEASRKNMIFAPVKDDLSPALFPTIFANFRENFTILTKENFQTGDAEMRRGGGNARLFIRSLYVV